jgi:hypothetical protein
MREGNCALILEWLFLYLRGFTKLRPVAGSMLTDHSQVRNAGPNGSHRADRGRL